MNCCNRRTSPIPVSNIRWCLPSTGSYKMNVDASGPSDDGKWGLVVVIRDDQGFVYVLANPTRLRCGRSDGNVEGSQICEGAIVLEHTSRIRL
ncbi:hypothetical protein MtrunA17_Chr2g0291401 [Medicago truncatula]|uniref:Polynucleotidyl transferase, Ribonuclease H fold n=1 Tax=Medicago truncatula TaxID=3880 RepID=Q2HSS0_MEDTR|nr:Polynucleotidyl transferase, Ribonuclease H fold [Medicago truncatula]RHN72773.1 hypothetical protein MtrunA17_Chr2g0291401 [Medicago truncatula]